MPLFESPNIYLYCTSCTSYFLSSVDGTIEVGIDEDNGPQQLISYKDPAPIRFRYFGLGAGTDVKVRFLYDCPEPYNGEYVVNVSAHLSQVAPHIV